MAENIAYISVFVGQRTDPSKKFRHSKKLLYFTFDLNLVFFFIINIAEDHHELSPVYRIVFVFLLISTLFIYNRRNGLLHPENVSESDDDIDTGLMTTSHVSISSSDSGRTALFTLKCFNGNNWRKDQLEKNQLQIINRKNTIRKNK